MSPELNRDLRTLERYAWDDEAQVSEIATSVRKYIVDLETRTDRLDKVEEILNKLEADGKTDILKHFESLRTS